jgi:hypothetical protein
MAGGSFQPFKVHVLCYSYLIALLTDNASTAAVYVSITMFRFIEFVQLFGFSMSPLLHIFFRYVLHLTPLYSLVHTVSEMEVDIS